MRLIKTLYKSCIHQRTYLMNTGRTLKVNMSITHDNPNFGLKKLLLWQVTIDC